MFNKLVDERYNKILELNEKVDPNNLIYRFKGSAADAKFNGFENEFNFFKKDKGW